MSGIVFFKTQMLEELEQFYTRTVGCSLWLDEGDCKLFRHGNLIFGLCERDKAETEGILTFFYPTRDRIDLMYKRLKDVAASPPQQIEEYGIYQFSANDPEGRSVEFRHYEHPLEPHRAGDELLLTRRSFRKFKPDEVSESVLKQILDVARYAPTSKNSQSYYFKIIRDADMRQRLSEVRGDSSAPINSAPLAVAIIADPIKSQRHFQDACLGAYQFILSAWSYGLGTCWIAAMDRDDVKSWLGISGEHYVATITPLGYPIDPDKSAPRRDPVAEYTRD